MDPVFANHPTLALLIETAVKGTALLAIAWLVALAMRRSSAAARHLVWSAALGALLVLPVLAASLPAWRVLPLAMPSSQDPAAATRGEEPGDPPTVRVAPPAIAPAPAATPAPAAAQTPGDAAPPPATPAARPFALADILVVAWVLGVVAVFGAFVGGHLTLRRIVRDARPFDDAAWLVLAQQCAARLALALPYALLRSPSTGMPLTFGLVHPRLLLPADAAGWPVERRRVVLLHELAHVQRRDCLTQAMAQLACALFWFHPAVWYAARRLRIEREHACDDRVLAAETRASDYADHLVDVVRTRRAPALSALGAVAFARPSQLEGRLVAVLDPTVSRSGLSLSMLLRASALAAVLVTSFAMVAPAGVSGHKGGPPPDARAMAPSAIVRAPQPANSLAAGLTWMRAESARRNDRDFWIGYRLAPSASVRGGVIGGDEGINLAVLDEDWVGSTIDDLIEGRAPRRNGDRPERDGGPVAMLVRGSPRGQAFDLQHIRFVSTHLPVDLAQRPLYWIGDVNDAESIAWLRTFEAPLASARMRSKVVEAIGVHGRSDLVVPYLRERTAAGEDEKVRRAATEWLGGHPSPETRDLLVRIAHDDASSDVRREAAESLGRLGTPEAMAALIEIAREGEGEEVRGAFNAFEHAVAQPRPGDVKPAPKSKSVDADGQAVKKGQKADKDKHWDVAETEVQREAVQALGRYPEERSLPRLIELTDHPNPDVARQAVESIGMLRSDNAIAVLSRIAWKHPNVEVQRQAVEGMRFTDKTDKPFTELLRIARQHPVPDTRRQAVETLGRLDDPRVFDTLLSLARTPDDAEVARVAVESLGRRDEPGVMKHLAEIAESHPIPEVRRQAVEAMGRRDPEEALPYLEKILEQGEKH
jgi:beta-lactamase regulating signal transducer with metallopeptidase domain/HEAT repeat protein